jgi:hypothetical protein
LYVTPTIRVIVIIITRNISITVVFAITCRRHLAVTATDVATTPITTTAVAVATAVVTIIIVAIVLAFALLPLWLLLSPPPQLAPSQPLWLLSSLLLLPPSTLPP